MITINTFLFIAILVGVWMFGFLVCGVLASSGREDLQNENQLLTGSLREKEEEIKKLETLKKEHYNEVCNIQ